MSKITGVPDFKDFIDQNGIHFAKKMNIYIGYYNYIMDIPLDTSKYNTIQDWAYLFPYCILTRSIYKTLNTGYIVLYDRDYFSLQDDQVAGTLGLNKKSDKGRKRFLEELGTINIVGSEAERMTRYKYELEKRQ